ncbi:hypothetical protein C8R44DRAFT_200209 [Mycena epipterygia]|nr:hypothetical protein C8R44DRAFT_200209 [Mycena epipterygia]
MKISLFFFLTTLSALVSGSSASNKVPCGLRAWVRAEDLSPNHVSDGELRVQVKQANCTNQIVSVALRLQLSEFSEVKYMKDGAFIPRNQTVVEPIIHWGPTAYQEAVYRDEGYEQAKGDPAVWTVKAETRTAWSTKAVLIENSPNISQPIVVPFIVSSPAVNYPPAAKNSRLHSMGPRTRFSDTVISYRYVAVVTLADGRVVEVPAGYTNFVPVSQVLPTHNPFTLNTTFADPSRCDGGYSRPSWYFHLDRCLPAENRTRYVAEVTLEEGNVVRQGQPLKGRVTIHSTQGSTTMDSIQVTVVGIRHDRWAHEQAAAGGDTDFSSSAPCRSSWSNAMLSPDSEDHAHIFDQAIPQWKQTLQHPHRLSAAKPYFDFELQVPQATMPEFSSYYGTDQTFLHFGLNVRYNSDRVEECKAGGPAVTDFIAETSSMVEPSDRTMAEHALWDEHTPVGQPAYSPNWFAKLNLNVLFPIIVLGDTSSQSVDHYLTPGLPSPVILPARADITFPITHPVVREEPYADTCARLLQPGDPNPVSYFLAPVPFGSGCEAFETPYPDPAVVDRAGCYAGVLWKKKIVAEERGLLPSRNKDVESEESGDQSSFM